MKKIEQEAIILNSAWKMIDGMVNWSVFVKNDLTDPTNLMFETREHARIFIVLLGDFLSEVRGFKNQPVPLGLNKVPSNARPSDLTFIYHLRRVCESPILGENVGELQEWVESFADWLEGSFIAPGVNLADIDVVVDLYIERYRYIKMCGDIAKHHLGRLANNIDHLRRLLKHSGYTVGEQEAYLAVDNFFEWFFDGIFMYHSSQIAEFLNNIRWAIFDYLQPEFQRSWHLTDDATRDFQKYSYHVPDDIMEPVARAMYWDVMNRVRAKPWMHRFVISEYCKRRY